MSPTPADHGRLAKLEDHKDELLKEVSSLRSKVTVLQWLVGILVTASLGMISVGMATNVTLARIETRQQTNSERILKITDDDREQDRIIASLLSSAERLAETVKRLEERSSN